MRDKLARVSRRLVPRSVREKGLSQRRYGPDVFLRSVGGPFRYVIDRPQIDDLDAYQHNLALILELLEARELENFLVSAPEGMSKPVVGMPRTSATALLAAIAEKAKEVPIYVSGPGRGTTLATSISPQQIEALTDPDGRIGVFCLLRNSDSGRLFDDRYGTVVEVWSESSGSLSRAGATQSAVITPDSRREPRPIVAHGLQASTFAPLDQVTMFSVDFPIDAVYMWVDGSDPEWQKRKAERLGSAPPIDRRQAEAAGLYRQFDELRYSLRALERYAPWVRTVYLVTDRQRPAWLDETETNLRVVDHTEILPESALPTFNSHAITAALHHIPGLSEHFLVVNDDIMFGRPTRSERFFNGNGIGRFFLSKSVISDKPVLAHEKARVFTCDLIEGMTGSRPTNVFRHTPHAFNRELLADLEQELAAEWKATIHNPFRSPTDIVPSYLHHYVAYHRRLAMPAQISYSYFALGSKTGRAQMREYPGSEPTEVVCINEPGDNTSPTSDDVAGLVRFLEGQLPRPSAYERAG